MTSDQESTIHAMVEGEYIAADSGQDWSLCGKIAQHLKAGAKVLS
jgi:hypothetical protein